MTARLPLLLPIMRARVRGLLAAATVAALLLCDATDARAATASARSVSGRVDTLTPIDNATDTPVLEAPVAGTVTRNLLNVSFTLPEAAKAGTVKLGFGGLVTLTLAASMESAGAHSFSFNASNPLDAAEVAAGAVVPDGLFTVTLSYQDVGGNPAASASVADVRVDSTAPAIGGSFSPLSIREDFGLPDYRPQVVASDVSGIASITQSPAPGASVVAGTRTVTLTAVDGAGNSAQTSFNVTVTPSVPVATLVVLKGATVPGAGTNPRIPAGAVWSGFGAPSMNDSGQVAFLGTFKAGALIAKGIFAGTMAAPVAIALTGASAPDTLGGPKKGTAYASFRDPLLTDDGREVFLATLSGNAVSATNSQGIYSNLFGYGPALELARTGAVAPGAPTGARWKAFVSVAAVGKGTASDRALAFTATLVEGLGGVTSANDLGLWIATSAGTTLALREGTSVTWLGKKRKVKSFAALASRAGTPGHGLGVASGGQLVVSITFTDGTRALAGVGPAGLELLNGLGGESAPGGGEFTSFGLPVATDGGAAAFSAKGLLAGVQFQGVYAHDPATGYGLGNVALTGQQALPSGPAFAAFGNPVNNLAGAIAFSARLTGTGVLSSNDTGIWWHPDGGTLGVLAREGDAAVEAQPAATIPKGVKPLPVWNKFVSLALPDGVYGPLFVASMVNASKNPKTGERTLPGPGGVTTASDVGLWGVDSVGDLRLLLREGGVVGVKTIRSFNVLGVAAGSPAQRRSFNSLGQVLCRVIFTDGTQAMVRVQVP